MKDFMMKKRFNLLVLLLVAALAVGVTAPVVYFGQRQTETSGRAADSGEDTWEARYAAATKDAMTIEPEEMLPVLAIDKNEKLIRFNEKNQVLMVTMHHYPDSYPAGQEAVLEYGEVWVTSMAEMEDWFKTNYGDGRDEENWTGRFETLLGMAADSTHTHFTAFWADPEDMTRPAYNTDITDTEVFSAFADPEKVEEDYKEWFDGNIIWSYFESEYPWTRLGYTYDYADNGTEYGLSEFLVNADSTVDVEFTYTVDEMVEYLKGL